MDVQGNNGQISFDGRSVHVTRGGLGGSASHLEPWSMPITALTDVVLREPRGLIPGSISFVTRSNVTPTGYISAAKDAQSVVFKRKHREAMVALQAAVLEQMK